MNRFLLLFLATSLSLTACSSSDGAKSAAAPATSAAATAAAPANAPNSGKVLQVLEGGGYNYAEVDAGNGQRVWMAGGPIAIKPGDIVEWGEYAVMRNFNSKTLNRTFEQILFVSTWGPAGRVSAQTAPHGTTPVLNQIVPQQSAPGTTGGTVKSVVVAGGYSYLEVTQGDKTVWLAVSETPVKAGDKITWNDGMVMQNFNAKSLGRTFDQIIFAGAIAIAQ